MNEYDNVVQSFTEAAPAMATTALDADPDKAARALQLSRATGVAPLVISADQGRFEEDHKAQMTADIVRGNSQLAAYIRGNPLADHVSNDDYGNLDNASRAFQDSLDNHPIWGKGVPKRYIAEPLMEGLKGAIYGAAEGFSQEPLQIPENYNAWSKGAYEFLGIPLRGLNAVAGGFMGGAGGLARQATFALGGDENQATRAEREARGIFESEMGRGGSGLQHADHAIGQVVRQNEALAAAKPWLDAGVDVPRGVHPLIDEIKVKTNDAWVDKIQTALDQAQNSLTKERDPELFKNFARQHFEDAQMGISGDRVAALYGDKVPMPDDGLLGWVPGIAEKLEAAKTFGEDVHVPLADWVTYMDPQLARELKDDIRAWPGGITKNEAALKDVAAPAIGANKEIAPIKEVTPEFEPITLDQRLDAYREEYRNMLEDATFDERGFRQSGLRDALDVVSSPFGVTGDRGRQALDLAIKHDRPDIAEALVQRAERLAQKQSTTPGVAETNPKYNDIKRNLERLKKEAEDYAVELREKLNASKLKNDTLIDGALPQVRTSAALEPMFAIGDRPVKLVKMESKFRGAEEYNFVDHNDKVIGDITLVPDPMKKQLYVAMVGTSDLKPNTMGPSLMRDIKRQLKELYPEYETITGMRVSGAREAAGVTDKSQMKPVVKLALSDAFEMSKEYTDLRNILETAPTKFGDVTADIKPTELYSKHEQAFLQAGQEELNRITGKTAKLILANDIRYEGIDGIRGVYHKMPGEVAKIIISALDFDKGGILRHEAIHHLYREGFFKPEEWNALIEASKAEGWRERYDIDARYEHLNELGLHEEAIAEAFRDWAKTREQQPINPVTTAFQKIWDLMQRIKDRVAEILGREPKFDELFEAAYSGELAQRAGREGEDGQAFAKKLTHDNEEPHGGKAGLQKAIEELEGRIEWYKQTAQDEIAPGDYTSDTAKYQTALTKQNAKAKIAEATAELEQKKLELANYKEPEIAKNQVPGGPMFAKDEIQNQLKAEAVGLDAKHKKKLDELLQKEYEENLAAAIKRAEAEQRTLQSKEWKEAAKEIRKEAEADVRARPDVQADLLIGSGELGGKKLERQRYELLSDDLSPEQKAMLPRHYYAKDGVPVDTIANLFGYSDGNHLIEALAEVNKGKEGRSAQENLKRLIDEETNRRMEAKFGKLQDNIMLDAMDQAFSETALNRIAEEWQGAAMQAGVQVIDKNLAKEEAQRIFSSMKVADINVERLVGIMGKLGRDAERALIAGKYADASVMMQRKYSTALIIAEAKKLEKERAGFDRTYSQMRKREIKSMEPEYTDMVHQIYQLIDKPVQRSIQDLQDSLARNEYKNLADFVEKKQNAMRVVDAWEPLMEGNWKKSFNDLTVDEFRGINGTIKNLVHNGKEERKIYKAGEAADFAELKSEFIQSIVDAAHGDFAKLNKGKFAKLPEQYFVQHIQMETFLNRLDGYDPNGVWFQYVYRDMADGAAQVDIWRKHFSKRLKDVPQPKNLHRTLDNPLFKDQDTGLGLPLTRRNLIGAMLNTGNSTNLKKLAEGYKLKSDDVMAWIHQHATKAEWDYVQHIWDVFAEIKDKSDTMYRSQSGVAPENIEIRPIDTPHGQYKGGYYPLIREPNQVGEGSGKVFGRDALLQENFVSALPPAGYTKKRTGAIYPLALEPNMMTNQMSQMLHDIGMRPALINASKIFMNKEIQSKIRAHFGDAWKDELKDYLVGVANAQNYMPQNQKAIMELAEFVRQNVISTVIGFNPGTVMKHGPTALGLSIKEVGLKNFAKAAWETDIFRNIIAEVAPERYRSAVRSLLGVNDITSNKTWNFIRENSLEIARRDRNWEETLFGATAGLQPFDGYMSFRAKVMQLASKPVALSDMLSAAPTWLAAYKEAQAAGKDHGESVALGDRAVRRAHGSTASTSRTSFQRNYNPYLTSVYNFWSDILNRQVETIWRAGDEAKLTNGNPVQKGLATVPILAGGLLAYSIWPSIVESHVSPHPHGDDESLIWRSVKQLMFTEMGGWVGIRDAATAYAFARDPHYGFTGTAWQGLTNLPRDLLRKEPLNKERAGKLIQDGAALMGTLTGSFPLQIGKSTRYVYGVKSGQENPRNAWQWLVGLRFGTNDKHSQSFEQYWKGH